MPGDEVDIEELERVAAGWETAAEGFAEAAFDGADGALPARTLGLGAAQVAGAERPGTIGKGLGQVRRGLVGGANELDDFAQR